MSGADLMVPSRDGTPIGVWRSGRGPPLLLVHGTLADHSTTWRHVLAPLCRTFAVYTMDRRGRNGSGDTMPYELQREAEDVAAVAERIGGAVGALGHSHGALCLLEAALLTPRLHRVILYEGVPMRGADDIDAALLERLRTLLAAGDLEGTLVTLLRDVAGVPPHEVALLRAQKDAWAVRLANTRTVPRELDAYAKYVFEPERFAGLQTPMLLLVGEDSPPREHANARGLAAALAHANIAVLPGQQHLAMFTAPETFVAEVLRFF